MGSAHVEIIREALGCAKCCRRRQVRGLALNYEEGRGSAFHLEATLTWRSCRPQLQ